MERTYLTNQQLVDILDNIDWNLMNGNSLNVIRYNNRTLDTGIPGQLKEKSMNPITLQFINQHFQVLSFQYDRLSPIEILGTIYTFYQANISAIPWKIFSGLYEVRPNVFYVLIGSIKYHLRGNRLSFTVPFKKETENGESEHINLTNGEIGFLNEELSTMNNYEEFRNVKFIEAVFHNPTQKVDLYFEFQPTPQGYPIYYLTPVIIEDIRGQLTDGLFENGIQLPNETVIFID